MIPRMAGLYDIIICPMKEVDLDSVLEIEYVSYPKPWTREHFLEELQSLFSFPYVAIDSSGAVSGYICSSMIIDEAEIRNVAVRPELRNSGLGFFLVRKVLDDCFDRDASSVFLEVRVSNIPAINLYKKLGFVKTGIRPNYYENGEDAIIMGLFFNRIGDQ